MNLFKFLPIFNENYLKLFDTLLKQIKKYILNLSVLNVSECLNVKTGFLTNEV